MTNNLENKPYNNISDKDNVILYNNKEIIKIFNIHILSKQKYDIIINISKINNNENIINI